MSEAIQSSSTPNPFHEPAATATASDRTQATALAPRQRSKSEPAIAIGALASTIVKKDSKELCAEFAARFITIETELVQLPAGTQVQSTSYYNAFSKLLTLTQDIDLVASNTDFDDLKKRICDFASKIRLEFNTPTEKASSEPVTLLTKKYEQIEHELITEDEDPDFKGLSLIQKLNGLVFELDKSHLKDGSGPLKKRILSLLSSAHINFHPTNG